MTQTGLRLERLPAQDMLDILHYYFETDSLGEKEEMDAKTKMRQAIYGQLYERPYRWGEYNSAEFGTQDASGTRVSGGTPHTATSLTHKPYIPPTPVNAASPMPFGNVLDAPLG